jgi:CelD/BcsL family acetyltransferase involved in cellulose biosynthesis
VTATVRLTVLKEIPENTPLREEWNALVESGDQPQVFYTYEWALAVQRAYKETVSPFVVLGYDGNQLCGVAALTLNVRRRQASFLGATTGDYCDFVGRCERRSEFVGAVLAKLREEGITRMVFTNVPADSPTGDAIRAAGPQNRSHIFSRLAYECAQIALDRLPKDKAGRALAPGLTRLRKFEKAMSPVTPLRTEHLRSWAESQPVIPEFFQAHVARFLETGRISNLADPDRQIFLGELAKLLSERQWFVLTRMVAGDRPAAWHYGLQFHGTWFWYQPTFDPFFAKHWPGFSLLTKITHDAIDDPSMKLVDLGLGAEGYKTKFANASRETLYINVHSSLIEHCWTITRYRVAKLVRSSPGLKRTVEGLRGRIRTVRARFRQDGLAETFVWLASRVLKLMWQRSKVNFYQGSFSGESAPHFEGVELRPLTPQYLAQAVTLYRNDEFTCAYLIRAAKRLRRAEAQGFVLTDTENRPVHFAWVAPFNGFYCAELSTTLRHAPESVMLFDCWTPRAVRGRRYYEQAILTLGARMHADGHDPWIFSATTNLASVKGIEKTPFELRYSLSSTRYFGRQKKTSRSSGTDQLPRVEASARG